MAIDDNSFHVSLVPDNSRKEQLADQIRGRNDSVLKQERRGFHERAPGTCQFHRRRQSKRKGREVNADPTWPQVLAVQRWTRLRPDRERRSQDLAD